MIDYEYLKTINLPDEVSHWVWKVYGQKGYYPLLDPNTTTWTNGIVMLYDISMMDPYDYQVFKLRYEDTPKIKEEYLEFFIERCYDVFGFIRRGWVANRSIYEKEGYNAALKAKDKALLAYQRELRKEEDKLGQRQETRSSLLERRSWTTFGEEVTEPVYDSYYETDYGYVHYKTNEIGKLIFRREIAHDGTLMYEGKYYYRKHKGNYFLYRYENTKGVCVNYDTISNERRNNKRFI